MTQQQLFFFFFFFVFFFFSQLLIPGYAICQAIDFPSSSHKARLCKERKNLCEISTTNNFTTRFCEEQIL
jgi:hypothetical protein